MRCSSKFRRWRVISSKAPNGSSSNRNFGLTVSARAMEARCFMPPDNWPGRDFSNPLSPTSSMRSSTTLSSLRFWISSGSPILRRTERHGSNAESWNAMPRPAAGEPGVTVAPLTETVPEVGVSSPARIRSTVDLPQPEGPISETKAPAGIFRLISEIAWKVLPVPTRNSLFRCSMAMPEPSSSFTSSTLI